MRQAEGSLQTWGLGQTHLCPGVRASAGGARAGSLRRDAGHSRGVRRSLPWLSVFLRFEVKSGNWVLAAPKWGEAWPRGNWLQILLSRFHPINFNIILHI